MRRFLAVGSFVVALAMGPQAWACGWTQVPSVDGPNDGNELVAVSADSPTDAWAVGFSQNVALAERWDGTAWIGYGTASIDTNFSLFAGVAAISPADAWAVGWYDPPPAGSDQVLIEHFDGSRWSVAPVPAFGTFSELSGVSASASNDVWAVGYFAPAGSSTASTLVLHFDGVSWTKVKSPNRSGGSALSAVSAVSASDVWAVGTRGGSVGPPSTLAEHWDGTRWSVVPSASKAGLSNFATGVSNGWMSGYTFDAAQVTHPFIEQWNGTGFRIVRSPGVAHVVLTGIAVPTVSRGWAVGWSEKKPGGPSDTVIEGWDGISWRVVSSPSPGFSSSFWGVWATATDAWAVGVTQGGPGASDTVIERNAC